MNCHNKENNINKNQENPPHKGHNHGLMMVLCLLPLLIIMILSSTGKTDNIGSLFIYLIILLCPLSHILMLISMKKNNSKIE